MKVPIRHNNFDFLRLFGAIGVMFSHSYALLDKEIDEPILRLTKTCQLSQISVYIFFIISGYLITRSFLNHPHQYWRNRILRVTPALTVNVIITTFIIGAIFTDQPWQQYFTKSATYQFLENILNLPFCNILPEVFKHNRLPAVNVSLWTLGSEILMYALIWFIGTTNLNFRNLIFIVGGIFLLLAISGIGAYALNNGNAQITILPDSKLALLFFIGSIFYLLRDKIVFKIELLITLGFLSLTAFYFHFTGPIAFIFLPYALFYFAFNKHIKLHHTAKYGDFSYGIYIYAYPIQQSVIALNHNPMSPLSVFLEAGFFTLIAAILSWHFIEKRMLTLKRPELIQETRLN